VQNLIPHIPQATAAWHSCALPSRPVAGERQALCGPVPMDRPSPGETMPERETVFVGGG